MEEQRLEQHGLEESEQGNNMQLAALIFPYPPPGYFATRSKHVVLPPTRASPLNVGSAWMPGDGFFSKHQWKKQRNGKKKRPHSNTQTRKRGTSNGQ